MAGNKIALKAAIKASYETVKSYDGSTGKTQDDAIEKLSQDMANAIESYVKTLVIWSTPVDVAASVMIAGGTYPVVSSNILQSKVSEL